MMPVVDEYTSECLSIDVERSISAEEVVETLTALFRRRGEPSFIRSGKRTTLAYLAAMIVEVVLLSLGALCLLMLVPLGQSAVGAGAAKALGALLSESKTMAYQISQMSLGLGALFLCLLLFLTRLGPQYLAGWGVIGYTLHVAGAIAEIFGIHISLIFLIPRGLFELALAFWLLIKGFQPEAYGGHAEVDHAEVRR